jgi:hypothetical protein
MSVVAEPSIYCGKVDKNKPPFYSTVAGASKVCYSAPHNAPVGIERNGAWNYNTCPHCRSAFKKDVKRKKDEEKALSRDQALRSREILETGQQLLQELRVYRSAPAPAAVTVAPAPAAAPAPASARAAPAPPLAAPAHDVPVQQLETPAAEQDDEVDHHSHASSELLPLQDQRALQHQQHQPQQPQQPQQQQQQPQQQHASGLASSQVQVLTGSNQSQQQQQQQQRRFEALCASLNKTQRHQRLSVQHDNISVVALNAAPAVTTRSGKVATFESLLDEMEAQKVYTGMTITLKTIGFWKLVFSEFIAKGSFGSAWRGLYAHSAAVEFDPVIIKRVLRSRSSPGELAKEYAMADYVSNSFVPNGRRARYSM